MICIYYVSYWERDNETSPDVWLDMQQHNINVLDINPPRNLDILFIYPKCWIYKERDSNLQVIKYNLNSKDKLIIEDGVWIFKIAYHIINCKLANNLHYLWKRHFRIFNLRKLAKINAWLNPDWLLTWLIHNDKRAQECFVEGYLVFFGQY